MHFLLKLYLTDIGSTLTWQDYSLSWRCSAKPVTQIWPTERGGLTPCFSMMKYLAILKVTVWNYFPPRRWSGRLTIKNTRVLILWVRHCRSSWKKDEGGRSRTKEIPLSLHLTFRSLPQRCGERDRWKKKWGRMRGRPENNTFFIAFGKVSYEEIVILKKFFQRHLERVR